MGRNNSFICCGSRKYDNLNLDRLVDSFDFIIRHNMLIPDSGYGKKTSSIQVINSHINKFYNEKISNQEWFDIYCEEYGLSEAHIIKFLDYMKNQKPQVVHFLDNNTGLMQSILQKHNIDHPFRKEQTLLKTGLSFAFKLVSENIKPFLVGYSLNPSSLGKHTFNTKAIEKVNQCHKDDLECDLIIKMHNLGLVDATFCDILDEQPLKIGNTIEATKESLEIAERYL